MREIRTSGARMLYLKYRGTKNVLGDKSWETATLEDFAELLKGWALASAHERN